MAKKRIVIKIGSSNLIKDNKVDSEKIESIASLINEYRSKEFEFIIVSSGSVSVGRERMNIKEALKIEQKQAMAAIGQPLLMQKYENAFSKDNIYTSQVLLTRDDLENRKRYINARDTINELLKYEVIPIINENDTVSTDEIKIGDNDNLSARVAGAAEADILIILSDIDGLYDKNPKENVDAVLIPQVKELTEEIWKNAGGSGSKFGTGGMFTKLEAAELCMKFGIIVYIINGNNIDNLKCILDSRAIGTKFCPSKIIANRRKMWIAYGLRPKGEIYIDEGAQAALHNGKSLLPSGVKSINGSFIEGDMVLILNENKEEIARGIANYSAKEIKKIEGRQSDEIEQILGYKIYTEVIHRDNMMLTE